VRKFLLSILLAVGIAVLLGCARGANTEKAETMNPESTGEEEHSAGQLENEVLMEQQVEEKPVLLANQEYQVFQGTVGKDLVVAILYREEEKVTLYYTNRERTKEARYFGNYDMNTQRFDLEASYFSKGFGGTYYINDAGQPCIKGIIEDKPSARNAVPVELTYVRSHDCYEGEKANFSYPNPLGWEYDPYEVLSSVEIFAEAVLKDNVSILEEYLQFPFAVEQENGVRLIRNREGFRRLYYEVISEETKAAVMEGLQQNLWFQGEELQFGNILFEMPAMKLLSINNGEVDSNDKQDSGQEAIGPDEQRDVIKITQASKTIDHTHSGSTIYLDTDFGRQVKTVKLYMEQWQNGVCTQSIPGILTENAKTAYVMMSFRYRHSGDYETGNGGVSVDADEYGGFWSVNFNVPHTEQITSWYLSMPDQGEELVLKPGEERILSAMTINTGENVEKPDCKMLEADPELLRTAEYVVTLRLVCEAEEIVPKNVQNREPLKIQMLSLEKAVPLEDGKKKEAYISALENMIYYGVSPDGEDWLLCNYNDYTLFDVDFDGRKELIIHHYGGIYSDNRILIYDYDSEKDALYKEFDGFFEGINFYDNGVVEVHIPHNQGPSFGRADFWPHILYRYNASADTYEEIAFVEGWYRKDGYHETYEDKPFPEEADEDGDGMVYFINVGERYVYEDPIDNAAYFEWRESIIEDAGKITFSFSELPTVMPEPKG